MSLQNFVERIELPDAVVYETARVFDNAFGPWIALLEKALYTVFPAGMQWMSDYTENNAHPLSRKLPMLTPAPMLFAALCYTVTVPFLCWMSRYVLPRLQLKAFSFVHSVFLTILSAYMWVGILSTALASYDSLWNQGVDPNSPNAWRMAKLIWLFYASKIPEFMDTFIMCLKGQRPFWEKVDPATGTTVERSQLTFLHCYHHFSIFPIWYFVTLEGPGGDACWSAQLNSWVHIIMYAYYSVSLVAGKEGGVRAFLNRHKFWITRIQMLQFASNNAQSFYLLTLEKNLYPRHLSVMLFFYMLTLLALFGNFLLRNEGAKQKGSKAKRA